MSDEYSKPNGTTRDELLARVEDLEAENAALKDKLSGEECDAEFWKSRAEKAEARLALHERCLERGLALWRKRHPGAKHIPDGAETHALLIERMTQFDGLDYQVVKYLHDRTDIDLGDTDSDDMIDCVEFRAFRALEKIRAITKPK